MRDDWSVLTRHDLTWQKWKSYLTFSLPKSLHRMFWILQRIVSKRRKVQRTRGCTKSLNSSSMTANNQMEKHLCLRRHILSKERGGGGGGGGSSSFYLLFLTANFLILFPVGYQCMRVHGFMVLYHFSSGSFVLSLCQSIDRSRTNQICRNRVYPCFACGMRWEFPDYLTLQSVMLLCIDPLGVQVAPCVQAKAVA